MSNVAMTLRARSRLMAVWVLLYGCVEEPEPMQPVPDAGAFMAHCQVTAKSSVACRDGGPCPFTYGAELDCGSPTSAVVVTAAAEPGRSHALFSVMDLSNVWHTQWLTFGPDEPSPLVRNEVLPQSTSSVQPRLLLAATSGEPPLAFVPGPLAARLDGGAPSLEDVVPDAGSAVGLVDAVLSGGGRGYALLSGAGGLRLSSRGADGEWTVSALPGSASYPSALTLGDGGLPRVAYWVHPASASEPDELHVLTVGGGDVTLRREPLRSPPGRTRLALDGLDEPVVAYTYEGTHLVVSDGDAGHRRVRLAEQGVTNTCPTGALHVTCSECPNPTCTRRGESISDIAMARSPDGAVYVALLMHVTDVDATVTAKPTKFGGVEINCDCDIDITRDDSKTTEIVLLRVVPGLTAAVERKMAFAVPERARQLKLEQIGGRFHVSYTDDSQSGRRPVLHDLVFDAASLQ